MKIELVKEFNIDVRKKLIEIQHQITEKLVKLEKTFHIRGWRIYENGVLRVTGFEKELEY